MLCFIAHVHHLPTRNRVHSTSKNKTMQHRRSQSDAKSTSTACSSTSTMPTINVPSTAPSTGRVSLYSMRERVIMNKMTEAMSKLAPDTETEVTSRLHQEIPAIRLDGHLTYCLYITLQNLIHINAIYIFLYHAVFWLGSTQFHTETIQSARAVEKNQYEETQLVTIGNVQYSNIGTSINIRAINKPIYLTLLAVGSFELINAFLLTLRKKLPYFLQRHQRLKTHLSQLLVVAGFFWFISPCWLEFFITRSSPLVCLDPLPSLC